MDMHFQVYWVAKQQSEKTDDLETSAWSLKDTITISRHV